MCVLNHKLTLTHTTKKEDYGVFCWMHSKFTLPGYRVCKVSNILETIGKTSYTFQSNFQEKSAFLRIHWIVNYFKI